MNVFLIYLGRLIIFFSRLFNIGHGSTWPGHIALTLNKKFIVDAFRNSKAKTIIIAGTNGKTTTAKLIQTILEKSEYKIFRNRAGANLLNGLASSIISESNHLGKLDYDFAIFEVDENTLPLVVEQISPNFVVCLNIFRDQLDRYGEVDTIVKRWKRSLNKLPKTSMLILNADDPQIAYLGKNAKAKTLYFGLDNKKIGQSELQHAVDSTYCPNCNSKLSFEIVYFSHLGNWQCLKCSLKRPKLNMLTSAVYPLPGIYNRYNTLAAILVAKKIGIDEKITQQALKNFQPAFGRQELVQVNNKKVHLFLSKNPTSFNESLRTVVELGAKNLLIVLNDRIPDGRDVSWIWDVDVEKLVDNIKNIVVSGDRTYDMALRLKYASSSKFKIEENLKKAIYLSLKQTSNTETLYVLPTYSAMLEVRKILTGRKIL